MFGWFDARQRERARVLAFGLGAPILIGLIAALPKSAEFAAQDRLALTLAVFAVAVVGLIGFTWSRRRYREQAMMWRYGSASSAVRDTLSYLKQERRLAARRQLGATAGAVVALALHLLAHLPQASAHAATRPSGLQRSRPAKSQGWNPLQNNDDALEIATRLIAALRLVGMETGTEGSFFLDSAKVFLRHAIALVRAAATTPAPSLIDVYRLSQENEDTTPLYHEIIAAIGARYPGSVPAEITDAIAFFEREWATRADRQKSGVRGTITQLLDEFLVPPFREIFTRPSTLAIGDMIDQSKILYVHMPASDRERMSRLVNTIIKLEYQRNILKRVGKDRPTFLLCDEFQTFYTMGEGRGDSDFFERSRESLHANIIAAQNLSAFMKRTKNAHDVRNFLGNCAVKIFLRQTEEETNRWASDLFGQRSEIVVTTSRAGRELVAAAPHQLWASHALPAARTPGGVYAARDSGAG